MSRLPAEFHEDRALRDAAREVFKADVEHARTSLSREALIGRVTGNVAGRVGAGAVDVYEVAKGHADDKRGILAIIIAFIALWFAREPIAEVLGEVFGELDDTSDETDPAPEPEDESTLDPEEGAVEGSGDQKIQETDAEAKPLEAAPLEGELQTTGET